jgi:TNF receptor-associated factor 4
VWKIKDVRKKLREARGTEGFELTSDPFYTSETGYKLQASLFLNGNGVGDNTHVSVYVKILPGDYDPLLQWPFPHNVSFTLYDQHPDAEKAVNVVESFRPDPSWENFKRPSSTSNPDTLGFGFPMFVPHNILFHPSRHYIRDDAMFLRVKIIHQHPM